jgi:hypothetical protein
MDDPANGFKNVQLVDSRYVWTTEHVGGEALH